MNFSSKIVNKLQILYRQFVFSNDPWVQRLFICTLAGGCETIDVGALKNIEYLQRSGYPTRNVYGFRPGLRKKGANTDYAGQPHFLKGGGMV